MSNKVLVTGCSGFIGKHLIQSLLNDGYEVIGIDIVPCVVQNPRFHFEICDIRERESLCNLLKTNAPEFVFHLAARTDLNGQSLEKYSANTVGVENLLAAIRESNSVKRCIFTSSQLVCRVGYVPKTEYDYCPNTIYGESKVITEKNVRKFNGGNVEWCLVRPTTIWGPGMSKHYQFFFRSIAEGHYFHIGKSLLLKSYGYIANTVYQYIQLMNANRDSIQGKTFYLADYEPLSLRKWVDAIQNEMGVRPVMAFPIWFANFLAKIGDTINWIGFHSFPFTSFRLTNILTEYRFDLSNTRDVCGDLPFTVDQGVKETVRWLHS